MKGYGDFLEAGWPILYGIVLGLLLCLFYGLMGTYGDTSGTFSQMTRFHLWQWAQRVRTLELLLGLCYFLHAGWFVIKRSSTS